MATLSRVASTQLVGQSLTHSLTRRLTHSPIQSSDSRKNRYGPETTCESLSPPTFERPTTCALCAHDCLDWRKPVSQDSQLTGLIGSSKSVKSVSVGAHLKRRGVTHPRGRRTLDGVRALHRAQRHSCARPSHSGSWIISQSVSQSASQPVCLSVSPSVSL